MINSKEYRDWCSSQCCIDCGEHPSKRSKDNPWATEVQCMECFKSLGPAELRGKYTALEAYLKHLTIGDVNKVSA